jgi:hypothetical protein
VASKESSRGEQLVVSGLLVAQLHHVHTACERGVEHAFDAGAEVGYEVEPGASEALATLVHGLKVDDLK